MTDEDKPTTAPVKKAATKPAKKTRAPRVIDPAKEAILAKCRAEIKALKCDRVSNRILQTIIAKRLPQLTQEHRQALFDELAKTCTPPMFNQTETEKAD
jgi:hypothetical protein